VPPGPCLHVVILVLAYAYFSLWLHMLRNKGIIIAAPYQLTMAQWLLFAQPCIMRRAKLYRNGKENQIDAAAGRFAVQK